VIPSWVCSVCCSGAGECIVLVGGVDRFFFGGPYRPYSPCSWQGDFYHKGHTGHNESVTCEGIDWLIGHQHILLTGA
jgi:hypothetical protein